VKEHEWSDYPICPHCGYVHKDAWEMFDDVEGNKETNCHSCDRPIIVNKHCRINYSTKPL